MLLILIFMRYNVKTFQIRFKILLILELVPGVLISNLREDGGAYSRGCLFNFPQIMA